MRAVWSGSLSSGHIATPVKFMAAVQQHGPDLYQLSKEGTAPVHYVRIGYLAGTKLDWNASANEYPYAKNRNVMLGKEDLIPTPEGMPLLN